MKKDPTLEKIIHCLTTAVPAKRAFLFGSRAKGLADQDSDYDILLVVDSSERDIGALMDKGHQSLWEIDAFVDIVVMTESKFQEEKNILSSLPEIALSEGIEVYAS